MEKLVYKCRYENIEHCVGLMSHLSAVSLRALAASKCIPRGMTPTFEAIQRHLEKADRNPFSVSRIFRTLGIGMQFDIKMMVRGYILSFLLEYPRETLKEMSKDVKPRIIVQFGNDGFHANKMGQGSVVGCYMTLSLLPAY